jgi:hypothetical protein
MRPEQVFASAGLQTLYGDKVSGKQVWCLESVAWEISKATSGGNTRCRLYIDRGSGDKHYLDETLVPVATWLYTWSGSVSLYEGERIALEIDQGQASTEAKMDVTGYIEEG